MLRIFLVILFMCLLQPAFAQYNDSTHYNIKYATTGSINRTDESSAYLLSNVLRFGVRKEKVSVNLNSGWVYGTQNKVLTNNDVTTALDFNFFQTPRFYYWGLGNYTSSVSLKINNQYQTGVGIAYNILDSPKAFLNISEGILYEGSDIVLADSTNEIYNTFRNSLRISFRFVLKERITLSGTGFLQNSLSDADDYIIRSTAGIGIKLNQWLNLTANVTYNNVSKTQKENLLFVYGLTLERYF